MRKVVVIEHVTLDGVMQAPGRPDEDDRGRFEHGDWAHARTDEVMGRKMGEGMAQGGPLLFGRRTYEDFFSFWPNQTDNPYTSVLDNAQKYVASTTLKEPPAVEQLHAPRRRRGRGGGKAQEGAGQGLRGARQRAAGPVADAAGPRRRARAHDPPARPGDGRVDVSSPTEARSPSSS
jgi:hypothetical protein